MGRSRGESKRCGAGRGESETGSKTSVVPACLPGLLACLLVLFSFSVFEPRGTYPSGLTTVLYSITCPNEGKKRKMLAVLGYDSTVHVVVTEIFFSFPPINQSWILVRLRTV